MQTKPPPIEPDSLEEIARGLAEKGWLVEWLDANSLRLTAPDDAPRNPPDPEGA